MCCVSVLWLWRRVGGLGANVYLLVGSAEALEGLRASVGTEPGPGYFTVGPWGSWSQYWSAGRWGQGPATPQPLVYEASDWASASLLVGWIVSDVPASEGGLGVSGLTALWCVDMNFPSSWEFKGSTGGWSAGR